MDAPQRMDSHMLVLTRKHGEKILIGDCIEVSIVHIGPNTVRLGIDAPREISIVREELAVADASSRANEEGAVS